MYAVNLVLQFYSRKIFLEYLGTEILGLNTTATNLLQFLNLAELGISSAVAFSLYKPLHEGDKDSINRIVTFNGLIYKRIACIIIIASCILMCFFPLIFAKMSLPIWYAYASFLVLLFSSLLGYFVNYKQLVLSADQKDYKIQYSYKLSMLLKVVIQIIALQILPNPYICWLLLEVIFTIIGALSLNHVIKKTYPYLKHSGDTFKKLRADYPEMMVKIKQLFVQKISGFVLFQTSPLIIYALTTMSLVALYGNYQLIIQGLISLLAAMFNSMVAGIGNLIASSKTDYVLKVFFQLYSLRFYIISVLSYGAWIFGQPFILWWIGDEYLLPKSTLAIMVLTFFFYTNRYIIYDYLSAYGFFGDIWASITEVVLNIGLSIILGLYWGMDGVLTGVLLSIILISIFWKPFYLFKIKLKTGFSSFWAAFIVLIFPLLVLVPTTDWIFSSTNDFITNILKLVIFSLLLATSYFLSYSPFRVLLRRFTNL